MNAKQQYQLALTIERGRRTIAAIHAWSDYDRYCEITSYSDGSYEENAEMVDEMIWREEERNARALKHHKAMLEQYEVQIDQRFFELARATMKKLEYVSDRTPQPFCVFHEFRPISCVINYRHQYGKDEITSMLEARKLEGSFPAWYDKHKRQPTRYELRRDAVEYVLPHIKAAYPHRFQQATR